MVVDENKPKYKNMDLLLFQEQFQNEKDCYQWLFNTRWPKGFYCPFCGHQKYSLVSTRMLYKCMKCGKQISITAGTIFHKTKTPLLKWFWLIFRMATSKTGVSIAEMQRELEIKDYKTIWTMAHKIRKAMADRDAQYKLAGLVELDESFFGPPSEGKRGRGAKNKGLVIVAVSFWVDEKGKEHPGFAHAFVVEDASAETIESVLKRLGLPEEEIVPLIGIIRTDGWRSYQTASTDLGIIHYRAVIRDPKDSMKLLPWTHRIIANAKSVFRGPHRGVSKKHLQRYLSEVCYRFNRRFWPKQSFHRLLRACVSTSTITRDDLMIQNLGELRQ
jgi:transposase-like protein